MSSLSLGTRLNSVSSSGSSGPRGHVSSASSHPPSVHTRNENEFFEVGEQQAAETRIEIEIEDENGNIFENSELPNYEKVVELPPSYDSLKFQSTFAFVSNV